MKTKGSSPAPASLCVLSHVSPQAPNLLVLKSVKLIERISETEKEGGKK